MLVNHADTPVVSLSRTGYVPFLGVDFDPPGIRFVKPNDALGQSAFTGAILPQQRVKTASGEAQVGAFQCHQLTKALG